MTTKFYTFSKFKAPKSRPPFSLIHLLLMLFLFLLFPTPSLANIYYLDAINGQDNNNGLSESTPWKTIAKVNASNFNPGDQILFKRGAVWREQLNVPSSGGPGLPILFGSYGAGNSPIISGADIISGWSLDSGANYAYKATVAASPNMVFEDGARMTKVSSRALVESMASSWYWASNVLYIRPSDGSNPSTNGKTYEVSQRASCIAMVDKSYVSFENLKLQYANSDATGSSGFDVKTSTGNVSNINLTSIESSYNYQSGFRFKTETTHTISYCTLTSLTGSYNCAGDYVETAGNGDIFLYGHGGVVDHVTLTNSTFHNSRYFGIDITHVTNSTISNCVAHDSGSSNLNIEDASDTITVSGGSYYNGGQVGGDSNGIGIGGIGDSNRSSANITVDGVEMYGNVNGNIEIARTNSNALSNITVKRCKIHNGLAAGIGITGYGHSNIFLEYNLIYSNGGHGIYYLGTSQGSNITGHVYNNTVYGNTAGAGMWILYSELTIKNNVISTNINVDGQEIYVGDIQN